MTPLPHGRAPAVPPGPERGHVQQLAWPVLEARGVAPPVHRAASEDAISGHGQQLALLLLHARLRGGGGRARGRGR